MKPLLVLDIETYLIKPGYMAPKPVVVSMQVPGEETKLYKPQECVAPLLRAFENNPDLLLVGQNIAFDVGVMLAHLPQLRSLLWSLYLQGRVSDTMIREKLIKLAQGRLRFDWKIGREPKFTLGDLVSERLGEDISAEKTDPDSWRFRYSELDNVAIDQWPEQARLYAAHDISLTRRVWESQAQELAPAPDGAPYVNADGIVTNEREQTRAALALHLMSAWGLRTDAAAVNFLDQSLTKEQAEIKQKVSHFFRNTGAKNMEVIKNAVNAAYKGAPPLTDATPSGGGGNIKTDATTLEESGDPELVMLAELGGLRTIANTFIPVLQRGAVEPLHPGYDILKETGRTSSYNPNIQNLPRKGGVRECFVPRPGYLFVEADYSQIELCALSQVLIYLFGKSKMADAINAGQDLHVVTASVLLNRPYSEIKPIAKSDPIVKAARQLSKAANFGYPGGMGPAKFVQYAKAGYGLSTTEEESRDLKRSWMAAYPDMQDYFNFISDATRATGGFTACQFVSGRQRAGCGYCDGANTFFQGLAADGIKEAMFMVVYEAYNVPTSPLYGLRGGCMVHDELLGEIQADRAPEAAVRLSEIMVQGMKRFIPDVLVVAEPLIMGRWYKDAEPAKDKNGRLIPWVPKKG